MMGGNDGGNDLDGDCPIQVNASSTFTTPVFALAVNKALN